LEIIKSGRNYVVLDVGSGCGTEALYFSLLGCRVLGVELNADRFAVARRRKRILEGMIPIPIDCEFIRASIADFNISKTFDFIWMDEAFHHLEPRDKIITMLSRLVRSGGYIVITESNALNQLSLLRKRGFKTIKTFADDDGTEYPYGNERILRASKMKKLFAKEGISCISIRYLRVFPNINFHDKIIRGIDNLMPHVFKPLFVHYNYVGIR
jgi:SAM-dependent methyltransferase